MSDLVKLEAMYKKEVDLARKHKEKAADLKQKIEEEKGQAILKSVRKIDLSPDEFQRFQKALADRANVKHFLENLDETRGGNDREDGTGTRINGQ